MLKSKTIKILICANLVISFFLINSFAQEPARVYTPQHWQSFTELPDRLTDTTNYIGRFYQYSDKELYFKDSNDRLQKISDKEVYHPECYGAVGDGTTDDTAAFVDLAADIDADGVVCLMNKTYYLNTANGVTFSNRVNIVGPGTFTIGSGVGNAPAIIISGERSYLFGFEIIGDHTNFTNAALSSELRRSIQINADHVICENLKDTNSIVGIELNAADFCTIKDCVFINDIVGAGPGTNNYHCAIRINSGTDNKIIRNRVSGYGNCVLHGGSSYRNIINNNRFHRPDNNSVYISSGQWAEICGNIITETDDNGIKVRDSYHLICNNLIDQNSHTGGLIGIGVTGNGTPDADGFNGEGTLVIGNVIKGRFTAGIRMNEQDDGYHKNPVFVNNIIEMTGDANYSLYGIHMKGRTDHSIVKGNTIKNAVYGIHYTIDDANSNGDFHRQAMIADNEIWDSITYGILAVKVLQSSITGNFVHGKTGSVLGIYTSSWHDSIDDDQFLTIAGNHVKGPFTSGIYVDAADDHFLERIKIHNNVVEIQSGGGYGINVLDETINMQITNNSISGHTIGIYVHDPNSEIHTGMLVSGNDSSGGSNDGITLSYVNDSLISNNVCVNAAATRSGITLADCLYNTIIGNRVGDDQGTATQKYGVEEQGTSDYNMIINNDAEGLTSSGLYRYGIAGSNSLVKTNRMVVEADDGSGTRTFEIGEFKTIVIDPNGGNINLDPRTGVTWPMINEMIVVNTANAAETITFDSAGLNQAIAQNERAIFVFDGSNWLKVYLGS